MRSFTFPAAVLLLLPLILIMSYASAEDTDPPIVTLVYPAANQTIYDPNPVIHIKYTDYSGIDTGSAVLYIDDFDVSAYFDLIVNETDMTVKIDTIYTLSSGPHNLTFIIRDNAGNEAVVDSVFIVSDEPEPGFELTLPSSMQVLVFISVIFAILAVLAISGYIYLRAKRRFRLKKFLITHPVQQKYLILYVPILTAITFTILGLFYVHDHPDLGRFGIEIVLIIGFFIGTTPYAIDSQRELKRINRYEAAFAQLLFGIADGMRGGIDPARAIVEIAKTDSSVMSKYLRIASKNIMAGRAFEDALDIVAAPSNSRVVKRYTTLIAESTKIGGNIAVVVHRAARDLDDFVKVKAERRRQMTIQITIIYMALGVLLTVIYMLLDVYPKFEHLDMSMVFGFQGLEGSEGGASVVKMGLLTLKRRFFHLAIIMGIGSGTIIGKITEGKIRYGLIHSLVLALVVVLLFSIAVF